MHWDGRPSVTVHAGRVSPAPRGCVTLPCRVSSASVPCLLCARPMYVLCPCRVSSVPVPCPPPPCARAVSPLCPVSVWGYVRHQKRLRPLQFESYLRPTLNHSPAPDWIRLHPATTAFTPQTKFNFFSSPVGFYTELKTPHLSYIDASLKCCLMDRHWNSMRQSQ